MLSQTVPKAEAQETLPPAGVLGAESLSLVPKNFSVNQRSLVHGHALAYRAFRQSEVRLWPAGRHNAQGSLAAQDSDWPLKKPTLPKDILNPSKRSLCNAAKENDVSLSLTYRLKINPRGRKFQWFCDRERQSEPCCTRLPTPAACTTGSKWKSEGRSPPIPPGCFGRLEKPSKHSFLPLTQK